MSSADVGGERAPSLNRRQALMHLAVFTSLFVPLACIPYIPIRRHLLGLKQSVHVLSNNTLSLQHELTSALLQARLLREEKVHLVNQLRDYQEQLDTLRGQAIKAESNRPLGDEIAMKRLDNIKELMAQQENSLKDQIDEIKKHAWRDSLPHELLHDLSTSLADTASFIEEVGIQQGWSQSIPRDRGIDRMRQLALKLHNIAKARQSQVHDSP